MEGLEQYGCRYELVFVLLGVCGNKDELLRQVLSLIGRDRRVLVISRSP